MGTQAVAARSGHCRWLILARGGCSFFGEVGAGSNYAPSTMTMAALRDEMGTLGAAATDTRAASAIELTRASLDAVASTSAATKVSLAWLSGVAREPHLRST
jgi:hypothetical protein